MSISDLLSHISQAAGHERFGELYEEWREAEGKAVSEGSVIQWLRCIDYYVHLDHDSDGQLDWLAILDNKPSKILFPKDDDLDNDGVVNVLDPDPLASNVSSTVETAVVPEHLRLVAKAASVGNERLNQLQSNLYSEYGIMAINHTDQHAEPVLESMITILEDGLPSGLHSSALGIKYLYAFAGHSRGKVRGYYHHNAKAISVPGGISFQSDSLSSAEKIKLVGLLAHEIGHAFLLNKMSAAELKTVGSLYGNWGGVVTKDTNSFYSASFFTLHPFWSLSLKAAKQKKIGAGILAQGQWQKNNLISHYALTNIHEWFADAFAAHVIHRLGERAKLGAQWLTHTHLRQKRGEWTNYSNLSPAFRNWLETRLLRKQAAINSPLASGE